MCENTFLTTEDEVTTTCTFSLHSISGLLFVWMWFHLVYAIIRLNRPIFISIYLICFYFKYPSLSLCTWCTFEKCWPEKIFSLIHFFNSIFDKLVKNIENIDEKRKTSDENFWDAPLIKYKNANCNHSEGSVLCV